MPPYIRATCNPDADSWVADLLQWWIDQDTGFPIPERAGKVRWFIRSGDELKLIFPQAGLMPGDLPIDALDFKHLFLQAMDGPSLGANLSAAARYCMEDPRWRLSLQAHKFAGIR